MSVFALITLALQGRNGQTTAEPIKSNQIKSMMLFGLAAAHNGHLLMLIWLRLIKGATGKNCSPVELILKTNRGQHMCGRLLLLTVATLASKRS